MNLVAHQYLSFNNPKIQIGNILGEVVRGKNYLNYEPDIAKGIILHRKIDTWTDENEWVKNSSKIFHSTQNKFSPIIIDVLFDYFLIKYWYLFSNTDYDKFKNDCYRLFSKHMDVFPDNLKEMVEELLVSDWFEKYKTLDGVQETLEGISRRTKYDNNLSYAMDVIRLNEKELESNFLQFFPQIISLVKNEKL